MRSVRILAVASSLLALAPVAARAKGSVLASSTLLEASGTVDTVCLITNAGSRSMSIFQVLIWTGPGEGTAVPKTDTCTSAPLAPNKTCTFGGTGGVYGGGMALVGGKTKDLRGRCQIMNGTTTVGSSDMR